MNFEVRTDSLSGTATALGWARGHTVVIDRPADGGGQDLGFNGGELLHLAVAGCVSNDLFREARTLGLRLTRVAITAGGEFTGTPPTSGGISYSVEVWGDAPVAALRGSSPAWTPSPRSRIRCAGERTCASRTLGCTGPMTHRRPLGPAVRKLR